MTLISTQVVKRKRDWEKTSADCRKYILFDVGNGNGNGEMDKFCLGQSAYDREAKF